MKYVAPLQEAAVKQINRAFETWDQTAIFVENEGYQELYDKNGGNWRDAWKEYQQVMPVPSISLRRMLRHVARQQKRELIVASHSHWNNSRNLKIRRVKRLAPIYTHLDLVASDRGRFYSDRKDEPVSVWRDKTNSYYMFAANGHEVFEHFLEQCRTNPDFRKALRIPEKVNEPQEVHHRVEDRRAA